MLALRNSTWIPLGSKCGANPDALDYTGSKNGAEWVKDEFLVSLAIALHPSM
jgi:hypothetical protein